MSDKDAVRKEGPLGAQPLPTADAACGDRGAETGNERPARIAPADLARVRAIIDAALARRS